MRKNIAGVMIALSLFIFGPLYAADPAIQLRQDAPVYTGPVQEGDLEELKEEDFEAYGLEPGSPWDQYLQYRKILAEAVPGTRVPYRMRVVNRDLTLQDFLGFDVPAELSEARYRSYLNMLPASVDGRTIHYVFVYHDPVAREEAELFAN